MRLRHKEFGEFEVSNDFLDIPKEEIDLDMMGRPSTVSDWTCYKGHCFLKFRKMYPHFYNMDWYDFDQNVFYGNLPEKDGSPKFIRCSPVYPEYSI